MRRTVSDDAGGAARAGTGTAVELFADGGDLLADFGDVVLALNGAPVVGSERGCGQPVLQRRHEASRVAWSSASVK